MDSFLAIVIGSVLVVGLLARIGRHQLRARAWREAASALGFTGVRRTDGLFTGSLEGRVEGLRVVLDECPAGRHGNGTRFTVFGLGGGNLFLRGEDLRTTLGKRVLGVEEISTGAPQFDEQVYVQGKDAVVFAMLDAETRESVARLLGGELRVGDEAVPVQASVADGELKVEVPERGARSVSFSDLLRAVVGVARRLVAPASLPRRLARNLLCDPEPGFRLNTLVTLVREYPRDAVTRRALRAARHDTSTEVRLQAALALGEEGWDTLRAIVKSEETRDSCAARAVAALGQVLGGDEAAAVLRGALGGNRGATAIACLERLSRSADGASEGAMREALLSGRDDVRAAAARALGRGGTVAAVQDLRALTEAESPDVCSAARQAIARIQARLAGAAPGQLSLAGGEAGQLSLTESAAGQVSLASPTEPAAPPMQSLTPPLKEGA